MMNPDEAARQGDFDRNFDRNCIVFEAVQNFIVKSGRF